MGQSKGCRKPEGSGRKVGTPNRRPAFSVHERLSDAGYDVIGRILEDIPKLTTPEARVKVHLQLLEYCDARRKRIDVQGDAAAVNLRLMPKKDVIEMGEEAIRYLRESMKEA